MHASNCMERLRAEASKGVSDWKVIVRQETRVCRVMVKWSLFGCEILAGSETQHTACVYNLKYAHGCKLGSHVSETSKKAATLIKKQHINNKKLITFLLCVFCDALRAKMLSTHMTLSVVHNKTPAVRAWSKHCPFSMRHASIDS